MACRHAERQNKTDGGRQAGRRNEKKYMKNEMKTRNGDAKFEIEKTNTDKRTETKNKNEVEIGK